MKSPLLLLLAACALWAAPQKVEIESLKFEAYEAKGMTVFSGNVAIKKGEDRMYADKVTVYVDAQKQIERFEAVGRTSFSLHFDGNSSFEGKSDRFVYQPLKGELVLTGNAQIKDMANAREIRGEKVVLLEKTKEAKVVGEDDRPVKLIFEMDEKETAK